MDSMRKSSVFTNIMTLASPQRNKRSVEGPPEPGVLFDEKGKVEMFCQKNKCKISLYFEFIMNQIQTVLRQEISLDHPTFSHKISKKNPQSYRAHTTTIFVISGFGHLVTEPRIRFERFLNATHLWSLIHPPTKFQKKTSAVGELQSGNDLRTRFM